MNRDQEYHQPTIYSQIILLKPKPYHDKSNSHSPDGSKHVRFTYNNVLHYGPKLVNLLQNKRGDVASNQSKLCKICG